VPKPGEDPLDFIERVIQYLTVPDRRRMGERTAGYMRQAIKRVRHTPMKP
jgi:hypothetical protein